MCLRHPVAPFGRGHLASGQDLGRLWRPAFGLEQGNVITWSKCEAAARQHAYIFYAALMAQAFISTDAETDVTAELANLLLKP